MSDIEDIFLKKNFLSYRWTSDPFFVLLFLLSGFENGPQDNICVRCSLKQKFYGNIIFLS
jgi:hypothetical protein